MYTLAWMRFFLGLWDCFSAARAPSVLKVQLPQQPVPRPTRLCEGPSTCMSHTHLTSGSSPLLFQNPRLFVLLRDSTPWPSAACPPCKHLPRLKEEWPGPLDLSILPRNIPTHTKDGGWKETHISVSFLYLESGHHGNPTQIFMRVRV